MSENDSSADNQQERLKLEGWIVGFTDGDGCFCISINRNRTTRLGWQVMPEFVLTQGEKSFEALEIVKNYFKCGRIFINRRHDNHKEDLHRYCVRSLKDLSKIIVPFFKENRLKTYKAKSFDLFSEVVQLMVEEKTHLKMEGIEKIARISYRINEQKIPKFLTSSETIRRTHFKNGKI